jgi:hypothetical protein
MDGGAGDVGQPPPAARELSRGPCGLRAQPGAVEGVAHGAARRPAVQPHQSGGEPQVLVHGQQPVHRGVLEDQTEPLADRATPAHEVVAQHARPAARRREQRGQHQHGRRLAGAVRTEHADERARRDPEIEALEGPRVAVVASEARGVDRGRRGAHGRAGSSSM